MALSRSFIQIRLTKQARRRSSIVGYTTFNVASDAVRHRIKKWQRKLPAPYVNDVSRIVHTRGCGWCKVQQTRCFPQFVDCCSARCEIVFRTHSFLLFCLKENQNNSNITRTFGTLTLCNKCPNSPTHKTDCKCILVAKTETKKIFVYSSFHGYSFSFLLLLLKSKPDDLHIVVYLILVFQR